MDNIRQACVTETAKESPIEIAKNRLQNLIGETKEIINGFEGKLSSVITQPEPSPTSDKEKQVSQTPLEQYLVSQADEVIEINNYLISVQNRVQL